MCNLKLFHWGGVGKIYHFDFSQKYVTVQSIIVLKIPAPIK